VQLPLSNDYGVRIYNWHVVAGPEPERPHRRDPAGARQPPGSEPELEFTVRVHPGFAGSPELPSDIGAVEQRAHRGHTVVSRKAQLTLLSCFDVSYNQLNGAIPDHDQFSTFPCSSFAGNPDLYGKYCDGEVDKGTPGTDRDVSYVIENFLLPFWVGMATGLLAIRSCASANTAGSDQLMIFFFEYVHTTELGRKSFLGLLLMTMNTLIRPRYSDSHWMGAENRKKKSRQFCCESTYL
jgi:hypothetical protein